MGDAGPSTPLPEEELAGIAASIQEYDHDSIRDVHVLVTGFGPFKSFSTNPSWLIASSLSSELDPLPPSDHVPEPTPPPQQLGLMQRNPLAALLGRRSQPEVQPVQQPLRPPNRKPYRIHVHAYPSAVRVAYDPTSVLIPSLISPLTNGGAFPPSPSQHPPHGINFDYILHIGLASGRDSYTLETQAHRDGYVISDVDDQTGYLAGEKIWKQTNIPTQLDVGWETGDVLRRWIADFDEQWRRLEEAAEDTADGQQAQSAPGQENNAKDADMKADHRNLEAIFGVHPQDPSTDTNTNTTPTMTLPRKPVVKLSRDAGRFLCEFILMCSLVYRYREAQNYKQIRERNEQQQQNTAPITKDTSSTQPGSTSIPTRHDRSHDEHAPTEKLGKVAFLHVPNGIEPQHVAIGRIVAETAIRAIVASWEDGYRNPAVYSAVSVGVGGEKENAGAGVGIGNGDGDSGFESRGTGDAEGESKQEVFG
ncbi:hypothetical protein LTS08_000827 [Lithohypha guttulata]|nr:hypothetical protein LTS08_000827 [Lithohypha guttulata]